MTPEQKAAYIQAQAVAAMAEIQMMLAANKVREQCGLSLAYGEEDFAKIEERYVIGHNAVIDFFRD